MRIQCGCNRPVSKRHITVGTLIGVYLATSDEALPIFWARPKSVARASANCAEICFGTCFRIYDRSYTFKNRKKVEHHVAHCNEEYKIKLTDCDGAELVEKTQENQPSCTCDDCRECENSKLKATMKNKKKKTLERRLKICKTRENRQIFDTSVSSLFGNFRLRTCRKYYFRNNRI